MVYVRWLLSIPLLVGAISFGYHCLCGTDLAGPKYHLFLMFSWNHYDLSHFAKSSFDPLFLEPFIC